MGGIDLGGVVQIHIHTEAYSTKHTLIHYLCCIIVLQEECWLGIACRAWLTNLFEQCLDNLFL